MSTLRSPVRPAVRTAFLAALLWLGSPAAHSGEIYIAGQSAAPGGSVVIPVDFVSQGDSIAAVQFDLEYDNSVLSLSVTVGDATRNSGKCLFLADPGPDRERILIAGLNQNSIAGGNLVRLFVHLNMNAPTGVYQLKLVDIIAADPTGVPIPVNGGDGQVTTSGIPGSGVRLQSAGVLNGASLLPCDIAPGAVITLLGSGIGPDSPSQPNGAPASTALAGTSVLFDGVRAPLLYAAPNQINLLAPFGISGQATTQIEVTRDSSAIAGLQVPVVAAIPAIFTMDSSGTGPGAILNQDSTVNSPLNPAAKESVVVLFAQGAGETNPSSMDGQIPGDILPKPVLPVSVQMAGLDATVQYAGAAPGMIAGVLQVDCVVPASVPSGYSVPIVLTIGQATSQAGVTLAIR